MSDLRSLILNHAAKRENVPTPFWSEKDENGTELVDGHVALQDIATDAVVKLQQGLATDPSAFMGALLTKALINTDTGQAIFSDTDRDALVQRGMSELFPVFQQAQKFFGLGADALAAAKKNLPMTPSNGSGIDSLATARLVP